MDKYKYVIITIAIISVIVAGAVLIIYNIRKADTQKGAETLENSVNNERVYAKVNENIAKTIIETNSKNGEKISPNAIIIFNKYYKKCGHLIKTRENVSEEMVNINEEEFQELYSDWEIKQFNKDEIILYKEFEGECGEHYLLKENNGFISIYRIESNGDIVLIEETEISTQYLPQVDLDKLKEGITLTGKEELNSYIEDFE